MGTLRTASPSLAGSGGARLGVAIAPHQAAIMLADLKSVRAWHNPAHLDNWVDGAGYYACGGEIATGGAA